MTEIGTLFRTTATALLVAGAIAGTVAVAGSTPSADAESGITATTTPDGATATLETKPGGEMFLRDRPRQTISGETDLPPGTRLAIHVQSDAENTAVNETFGVRVRENSNFSVTTDAFADKAAGAEFTAWVSRNGTRISPRYDGRLIHSDPSWVTFSDQRVDSSGRTVVVRSVTLSNGGFVAIHERRANGSALGASDYLRAGQHSNVTVDLDRPVSGAERLVAVLHRDSDGDERWDYPANDGPILASGGEISDPATVTVQTPTPSASPTLTVTATPPDTSTATDLAPRPTDAPTGTAATGTTERTQPTTTGSGPGFDVVLAVVGVLLAALLATDRRD